MATATLTFAPARALAQSAHSASADQEAQREANRLFAESDAAYKAGRFEEAAAALEKAYSLTHASVLLYNLARAYEGMGAVDKSIDAYRRYLQQEPNPPDRGAIETRVATLQRQLDENRTLERQRDEERLRAEAEAKNKQQVAPAPPRKATPIPWIIGGVGLAGVATGFVFGGLAVGRHSAAVADPQGLAASGEQADAQTFATVANIAFVAGGIVAAVGLVWGIVDLLTLPTKTSGVHVVVGLATLGLAGRW